MLRTLPIWNSSKDTPPLSCSIPFMLHPVPSRQRELLATRPPASLIAPAGAQSTCLCICSFPFWYCLWSLAPDTSTAWCHFKIPAPRHRFLHGSSLLVGVTHWLLAGFCSTVCCRTGLLEQSSCYWCRHFALAVSLRARTSIAGPMAVRWAQAVGAQDTLGNMSSSGGYRYAALCLSRDLPRHPRLATDRSSFLFVTCRVTKWKAVV